MSIIRRLFDVLKIPAVQILFLIFIFCWLLVTIFILIQNQEVKHKLTKKQDECLKLKKGIYEVQRNAIFLNEIVGKKFPAVNLKSINPNKTNLFLKREKEHAVILLFTGFDCGSCLNTSLKYLESFYKKNKDKFDVIGINKNSGNAEEIWKQTRAIVTLPVYLDNKDSNSVFEELAVPISPLFLYVKKNTIVYGAMGTNDGDQVLNIIKKIESLYQND